MLMTLIVLKLLLFGLIWALVGWRAMLIMLVLDGTFIALNLRIHSNATRR